MTPENARELIADLVRPVDYDRFMDEYVGRRYLHARPAGTTWTGIIGDDPGATILAGFEDFAPTLTCHSGSAKVPAPRPRKAQDAEDFRALLGQYHQTGYTVRVPEATDLSPELRQLCRALEVLFINPASAAIFWSTGGLNAPVHHDEYDLLIIQVAGRKQWYISTDPPTLPNTWAGAGEPAPPLPRYDTVDVEPGDVLYLPRGTAHTVNSTTESIHVSVGFLPVTVRQALIAAIDALSESDATLRRGLNTRADALAFNGDFSEATQAIRDSLNRIPQTCGGDEFIRGALSRRRARMIEEMPKLAPSDTVPPQLGPGSRLRHHPLAMAELIATPNIADLRLPGDRVLVHPGAAPALQWIIDHPTFAVADIEGGLPDDVKIALATRLVASGYLEPVDG